MKVSSAAMLGCIFVILGQSTAGQKQSAAISTPVSVIQLIADPEKYDGKLVGFVAFLDLEPEHAGLYMHKEDYYHAILDNMLWLRPSEALLRDREKLDQRYVGIVGVFKSGRMGAASAGGIWTVVRYELWSDPVKPRRQPSTHHP